MIKTLLVGCSFSEYCGWDDNDVYSDPRCWYNIVAKTHQLNLTNISRAGYSNKEILHNTAKQLLTSNNQYQLIIIQLTSTSRQWFFRDENESLSSRIVGNRISDFRNRDEETALKTIQLAYSNISAEVERDLTSLLLIQDYTSTRTIPLMLINGMNFYQSSLNFKINLAHKLNLDRSLGFINDSLHKLQIDCADDNMHPGEKSNQLYAQLVGELIKKL